MSSIAYFPKANSHQPQFIFKRGLIQLFATLAFSVSTTHAQTTYYWDNNGSTAGFGTAGGTWAAPTTGNSTQGWSNNATGSNATLASVTTAANDQLNFGTNANGLATGTITVSGSVDARSLTVGSASGAITLSGGTITINATNTGFITNNSSSTFTINSAIVLSAGSPSSRNVTGKVFLGGNTTGAGSYAPVSGASLTLGGNGTNIGFAGAGNITINAANLAWTGAYANTGTLDLNGNNFTIGNLQSNTGSIITDNSAGSGTTTLTTGGANTSGFNGTITDGANKKVAFSHTGAGALTLYKANTFSGNTSVSQANKLILGNALALQNSAIDTSGAGSISLGTITAPTIGGLIGSKNLSTVLATNYASMTSLTINTVAGQNLTYSGNISEGSAGMTVTKNGTGTQILSGNNTYTGATTINAGTLQFAKTASLYNGTAASWTAANLTVNSSGTLALNVGGTGEFSTGNVTTILSNLGGLGGAVNNNGLRSGSTVAFDTTNASGSSFTIADTIANSTGTGGGAISLTKLGTGTLVLSGNNTYSGGTTISAGTLSLSGATGATGSGNVSIAGGAALQLANSAAITLANNISGAGDIAHTSASTFTISGSNTNTGSISSTGGGTLLFSGANTLSTGITSLNATSSSTLSFADGTAQTITLGSSGISLSTATLSMDVDLSGSTSDRLNFGGAATLSGTNTVNLSFLNALSAPQTWTLLTAASGLNGGTWTLGTYTPQAGYAFSLTSNATSLWLSANVSSTDAYWTGSSGTSWTATNFSSTINGTASIAGGALTPSSDVIFAGTGAVNLTTTLGGNYTIDTLTVSTPEVSINGSNTLTVNSSSANAMTISATGNTSIGANLAGSAGLTKSGSGILTLLGNNTYSGGTFVTGGTVLVGSNTALGNSTGAITINPGGGNSATLQSGANSLSIANNIALTTGTLAFDTNSYSTTLSGVVSGSGNLLKAGSGTLTLNGTNTYTGGTTINTGTLSIATITNGGVAGALGNSTNAAANLVLGGGMLEYTGSSNGSTDRNFTLTAGTTSTISVTNATTSLTISGTAANTTGSLTKSGGGTLSLSGNNSYTGATTISAGTLQIASTGLLGGGSYSGNISNSATFLFGSNTAQTLSGIISGSGSLTKNGTSALTLTGNNSYSGGTTINAGTIRIGDNNALGTGNITTNNNVTFASADATARTISANYTSILGTGVTVTFGEASGGTGNLTFAGNGNLNIGSGVTRTLNVLNTTLITQALVSGLNTNLTKTGAGTLILSANNTYTGATTISAGTLQIGNAGTTGSLSTASNITNNAALVFNRSDSITQGTHFSTNAISGTGVILQNGSGNLTLNAGNTYSGGTTLNSGTLNINNSGSGGTSSAIGTGTLTVNGGTLNNTSGSLVTLSTNNAQNWNADFAFTGTNDLNLGTGIVAMNATRTVSVNGGNLTVGGAISGSGFGLTKTGSGTLTLTGSNTYSGATTLNTGNISFSTTAALASTSGVNLANATALIYNGSDATLDRAITVTSGTGTIRNSGTGLLTLYGALTKNSTTLTLAGGTNGITVSGVISGSSASANSDLVIDGGTTTLTNANNSYNGPTFIINSGTLNANTAGALPTSTLSAVTINGSSTLALGASQSVASLSGTSGSTVNLNNNTLTINGSATSTYSGGISGTGNLVKNGTGTQTLAGATTFNGTTTVYSGTLQAATTGALANTSNIDLNGGSFLVTAENAVNDSANINLNSGTLAVSGTFNENVGLLTLSANSVIDLNGFTGILRFGGVGSWVSNTTLAIWNWNGTPQYNENNAPYSGGTRHVVFASNSGLEQYLDRISFYSGSGSGFVGNAFEDSFSQSGFTGTEIIAVPEPETYLTGFLLLLGFGIYHPRLARHGRGLLHRLDFLRPKTHRKLLEGQPPA